MVGIVSSAAIPQIPHWSSGPLTLDLGPDEAVMVTHYLGRVAGWVVVGADGPAAYWEEPSTDPNNWLMLKASVAVRARICLL